MASSTSRNRPGSARRAMEKDPLKRIDSPATCSDKADLNTLIDAIAALQTVDLHGLQRRLNLQSSVPHDVKIGRDASIRWTDKRDWEAKYTDLKEKYDELDAAQNDLKGEINKQIEEKEKLDKELKNIRAELSMKDQASSEQNSEILRLKLHVESADKDINILNQSLNEYKNKLELEERSLQEQQKAMEKVIRAKDEALTRLSQQMRLQLSEGNPNITDLSNQNRPSKLGEIYSELYDNEWTNAFEVLTKTSHLDEKRAIELLLKILRESSKHASNVSQTNMKTIEKLLSGSSEGPSPECKQLLREAQKHVDIKKADGLLQEFVEKITRWDERIYTRNEHVEIYSKKCFQLCWLMSIQDPPVVLSKDPQKDAHFDTNMYKHYTNSGDTFDYVVWPALLLHKDGPLLTKGVAQPYPRPRTKSAAAVGRPARQDDKSFDGTSDDKSRESASGSDRMDKIQYGYQARTDEKALESTSGSGRMDTTQYGYQTRNDATLSSKSGQNPMATQTYSANGGKYRGYSPRPITPTYVQVSELNQLYQPHIFQSKQDMERFQRFCQQVSILNEKDLRRMYGTYYDYYYTLYINQIFGNYRFT